MSISARVRVSAAVVCAGALMSGCALSLQQLPAGRSAQGSSYRVTADFERADRILLGAEVRIGQKIVGRVHDLDTDGRTAQVGLSLSESVAIPDNATANVELPSALGDPFIRLAIPADRSPHLLTEGSVIPQSHTGLGPALEASLATLGMVLNGSGLDQMKTIITELNTAFGGRGDEVRTLTTRLNHTLGTAAAHQGDLNRTLDAANAVAQELTDQQAVLDRGLDVASPVMALLISQRDQITALVDSTSALAGHANEVLAQTSSQLGAEIDQTAAVLASMRSFNTEVTPALTNMNRFLAGFSGAVRGDYLDFDGALDVPGSIDKLLTGGRAPEIVRPPDLGTLLKGGVR